MNKTHHDYPNSILKLFDKFVHGDIDRRGFIEGAGKAAISASVASAYLASLVPDFASAQQISPQDKRLISKRIAIKSSDGSGIINAYIVQPANLKKNEKLPVIIVSHENRGLNPHIEDIARRIALDNYIAIAPDALTSLGGYPGDEDSARALFAKLNQEKIRNDFVNVVKYAHSDLVASNGKIGAVGFCWGGGMTNYLAANCDEILAAVPFYGAPAPLDKVKNIKASLLIQYASDDERFNAMWGNYKKALNESKIPYIVNFYPDTVHGFNNDTTPRYNEKMAKVAWRRTIEFFDENLNAPKQFNATIKDKLNEALANNEIKGAEYILFDGGKIIASGAVGTGRGTNPLLDSAKVRVASISKLVTAFCAWELSAEGKLNLDADASDYLGYKLRNPNFPDAIITPRHILSHTSSIRDDGENYRGVIGETLESFFTPNDGNWVEGRHFSDKPIGYFCYSNLNMGVIGQIVEKLSGQRFDLYAHDNIIAPLGLEAGFNWSGVSDAIVIASSPLFRRANNAKEWRFQHDEDPIKLKHPIVYAKDGLNINDYKVGENGLIFAPQSGLRASVHDLMAIGQTLLGNNNLFDNKTREAMLKPVWVLNGNNGDTEAESFQGFGTGVHHLIPGNRCPVKDLKVTMFGHYGQAYGLLGGVWVDPISQKGFAWFTNSSLDEPKLGQNSGLYDIEERMMSAAVADLSLNI